ncbi:MAG: diaminopimelate epimerase [Gemmatimonadaceae bacterium]
MDAIKGRRFWKLTGSGNDFVFFDCRDEDPNPLVSPEIICAICDRRNGVGADGIVLFERDPIHAFGIRYYNRDGSLAELCGNASLCSVTLAQVLGVVSGVRSFTFQTSSGALTGRISNDRPELDMARVTEQVDESDVPRRPGEKRLGFARVGVPHMVILVDDVETVDVDRRGRELRHWPTLVDGANANFVSRTSDGWAIRTYERGVEEETLACGTGAVATCALLSTWNLVPGSVALRTRSGSTLLAGVKSGADRPTLSGEGRLVYAGQIADLTSPDRK